MPRKIYNGAFDGGGIIVKDGDSWRIAEHAPTQDAYPTYAAAFMARKAEISLMPNGPWKKNAAKELAADVWKVSLFYAVPGTDYTTLEKQANDLKWEIGNWSPTTGDKKADAAVNAYLSYGLNPDYARKPGAKEAIALLKHYDELLEGPLTLKVGLPVSWRIQSTLLRGDPDSGYRSYDELIKVRDAAITKAHNASFRGLGAFLVSGIAMAAASQVHLAWVTWAVIALTFGALAYAVISFMRKDRLSEPFLGPGKPAGYRLEEFRAGVESSRAAKKDLP
jgi:hypothetical protein